jgi:hypothetical protein
LPPFFSNLPPFLCRNARGQSPRQVGLAAYGAEPVNGGDNRNLGDGFIRKEL